MDAPKENAGIPDDKAIDDPIREAEILRIRSEIARNEAETRELLRIRSEIARNEAETRKFNSEAKDFDGKNSKGIKPDTIIKAVIGGMIAAGLLVAWFISYMQPILEKNRKLGELEKQIHESENKVTDQKLKEKDQQLEQKDQKLRNDSVTLRGLQQAYDNNQIAYNKDLQLFKAQNDSMKAQRDLLIIEYEKRIKNQGVQASTETKRLKDELDKIKREQQKTEIRAVDIDDKLISNWLIENEWKVKCSWEGAENYTYESKFYPNGKFERKDLPTSVRTWQIRDGTLTISIDDFIIYTAKISKMKSPVEGTMTNGVDKSGTWKMTKD